MQTEQDRPEESGIIHESLAFLANFACRHPWLVLLGTLLTCAGCLITSFCLLKVQTQRNDLISPSKDYLQRWQQYIAEFGDDDDMVVVVQGNDRKQMELALDDVAGQVAKAPDLYDRLFYKVDLRGLDNRSLLFLPTEQIRLIHDKVGIEMAPMLIPGGVFTSFWKLMSMQHLMDEARKRVAKVKVFGGEDDFLANWIAVCQGAGEYLRDPASYHNPWISIIPRNQSDDYLQKTHYFFSANDTMATLLVRPMKEQDGFTFAQKSIDGLHAILAETRKRYPQLKLGLTGLPVLENDEMIASQNDSNTAVWLALIGVALLYLVVYRGFRYPLMTVSTLLVGTVWALGWMTLTVGHLNILSSAFAVMLIGIGDYGVLWVTRFVQERQQGANVPEATAITAVSVGPGILTAALTTALAFFATMFADLKAVAELGWIAGCGVLLCALACFTVMPALLTLFDVRGKRNTAPVIDDDPAILSLSEARQASRQWLPCVTHRPAWVIPVCLGLTMVLAYIALVGVTYDHNLLHMQADNLESVHWEHKLLKSNPGKSWHAVSYTTTPEEATALKEKFAKLPEVSEVIGVSELVPRDQDRKLEQLRDIQKCLRLLPKRGTIIPHDRPDAEAIAANAKALCASLEKLEGAQIAKLRDSLLFLMARIEAAGDKAAVRLQEYEQLFTMSLVDDLHRLRDVSTPAPIQVADVPVCLRERYIGKNGKWLLRIFAKENLWEFENIEKFTAAVQTVDSDATGKPFSVLEGLKAMKNGFFWAGVYAFIAMVIVLLLDFSNVKHTLISLAPLFMGLIATLGLMVLCGIALNPANMIAFPLVLGVGANYGVYVLHDYRTRPRDRRYSLSFATGWAIMVAALAMILGFCTLMISQHRGLYSLGLVLTLGVTMCGLTALVFLPALLHMVSQRKKKVPAETDAVVERRTA